jgi:hypothetical protein
MKYWTASCYNYFQMPPKIVYNKKGTLKYHFKCKLYVFLQWFTLSINTMLTSHTGTQTFILCVLASILQCQISRTTPATVCPHML